MTLRGAAGFRNYGAVVLGVNVGIILNRQFLLHRGRMDFSLYPQIFNG